MAVVVIPCCVVCVHMWRGREYVKSKLMCGNKPLKIATARSAQPGHSSIASLFTLCLSIVPPLGAPSKHPPRAWQQGKACVGACGSPTRQDTKPRSRKTSLSWHLRGIPVCHVRIEVWEYGVGFCCKKQRKPASRATCKSRPIFRSDFPLNHPRRNSAARRSASTFPRTPPPARTP